MNTAKIRERIAQTSPRFKARMAGVSQLLEALTATFGQVIVPGKLFVMSSAAATAANILGHQQLFGSASHRRSSGLYFILSGHFSCAIY